MARPYPTAERIRELLHYNPETGIFTCRVNRGRAKAGDVVGSLSAGYLIFSVDRKFHQAHRLAWLYMTGTYPTGIIDHINRNPSDNRFSNLRDVGYSENSYNRRGPRKGNATGALGVIYKKDRNYYVARICRGRKNIFQKCFKTLDEAIAARKEAEKRFGIMP